MIYIRTYVHTIKNISYHTLICIQSLSLTKLRKNAHPKRERKSGRKRPRWADLDHIDRQHGEQNISHTYVCPVRTYVLHGAKQCMLACKHIHITIIYHKANHDSSSTTRTCGFHSMNLQGLVTFVIIHTENAKEWSTISNKETQKDDHQDPDSNSNKCMYVCKFHKWLNCKCSKLICKK